MFRQIDRQIAQARNYFELQKKLSWIRNFMHKISNSQRSKQATSRQPEYVQNKGEQCDPAKYTTVQNTKVQKSNPYFLPLSGRFAFAVRPKNE